MPWDRTRTGAVSSSRGPARWRARGAGAAEAGRAGEAGEGSARRRGAQAAEGGGAEAAGSGAVTPGAYGRGGRGRLSALLPCRAVRERRSGAVGRRPGGRKRWLLRIIGGRSWCRLRGMWRHSAVLLRVGAAVRRERYAGATFFSAASGRIGSEECAGASKRSVFVSTPEPASPPRSAREPHLASAGQHPSRSAMGRTISTVRCARTCWAVR